MLLLPMLMLPMLMLLLLYRRNDLLLLLHPMT
jgi:hypothetical protein